MLRYERLISATEKLGLDRGDVQIVPSIMDARDRLEGTYFDLLVLDILVSFRPESPPDPSYSVDLLLELHEGEGLVKPGHIIGITADLQVAESAANKFAENTWSVVEYSEVSDSWISHILNCISYINDQQKDEFSDRPAHGVDLAIVCALEDPELKEVLKLNWNWSSPRPLDDVTFVYDGHFSVGGRRVSVCAASAPRMGMVSTALRSATLITKLRPRLIAMCGICAGVKGKVKMGDVLFASPAWDFQSGKRVRDNENSSFSIAPHQIHPPALIQSHIEQLRSRQADFTAIAGNFDGDIPGVSRLIIGPVASGSAVLADGKVVEEIKQQHRDLIGVEMEIYGMFCAATSASRPQPLPFALKAVCDFADPDKKDNNQRYAAYASANVLRLLMENYAPRLLD